MRHMTGLIDTHTHLDSFVRRGELPDVLFRARAAGVAGMIAVGTGPDDWSLYRELALAHRGYVHYTAGLHPCQVDAEWLEVLDRLPAFWSGELPPVALGEIGLDRFHLPMLMEAAESLFRQQRAAFAAGLDLARRLECPVVIHSRGAFRECVEMIDASGVEWSRVVFHCFAEGPAEMAELKRRGGVGSFTGILTYRSAAAVRAAAQEQGLARLMIETDAPYLTPVPHRGETNEPAFVRHTAEYAAEEVFGVPFEELAATTAANARQFFNLPAA